MVFYVLSLNTLYVYNGIITQFCKFNLKKTFKLGSVALEQSVLRKLLKVEKNTNVCQLSASFTKFRLFFEVLIVN
jgi:hypothetical protein